MRKDAADALRYGCNGLMELHWRTRILGPNIAALARAGRKADADAILTKLTPGIEVGENTAYLDRLLLFKGVKTEEDVAATMTASQLNQSTAGYGLGLWHLLNGRPQKAKEYFEKATQSEAWQAFGYIAAEMELKKIK